LTILFVDVDAAPPVTVTVTVADAVCVTVTAAHVPDPTDNVALDEAAVVLLSVVEVVVVVTASLRGIISNKLIRHAPPQIVVFDASPGHATLQPVAEVL
jgi:hypothetical protein